MYSKMCSTKHKECVESRMYGSTNYKECVDFSKCKIRLGLVVQYMYVENLPRLHKNVHEKECTQKCVCTKHKECVDSTIYSSTNYKECVIFFEM